MLAELGWPASAASVSNFGSIMNRSKARFSAPEDVMTNATFARVFCRRGACRESKRMVQAGVISQSDLREAEVRMSARFSDLP